jgi:ankyrin repeat protein
VCNVDLAKTDGATPLYIAAYKGHAPVVSQLITARCNVHIALKTDGATPLFIAVKKGHTAIGIYFET